MVNTEELMLGNWIEAYDNFYRIELIAETFVQASNAEFDCTDIYPIPITEETLEKCGFYKYETSSGNWFVNDFDDKIFQLNKPRSDEYELVGVASPFKYLHELQNLYFIYRKEQLEINL